MNIRWVTLLIALLLSLDLYALRFGDLRVYSYLNEPFKVEVPLFDLDNIPLSAIEASIGSANEYKSLNLQYEPVLPLLAIKLSEKDSNQAVIEITSLDKFTTPYFELLLNITWPEGKMHHVYTVLLDTLFTEALEKKSNISEVLPISKRQIAAESTWFKEDIQAKNLKFQGSLPQQYGPTVLNESIWNIAKRYQFNPLTLPQVVLSIIGQNPEAFVAGNLNGLKTAAILEIPPLQKMSETPPLPAAREVEAHDVAWQNHQLIQHILAPPYFQLAKLLKSELPALPIFEKLISPTQDEKNLKIMRSIEDESKFLNLMNHIKKLEQKNVALMSKLRIKILENKQLTQQILQLNAKLTKLATISSWHLKPILLTFFISIIFLAIAYYLLYVGISSPQPTSRSLTAGSSTPTSRGLSAGSKNLSTSLDPAGRRRGTGSSGQAAGRRRCTRRISYFRATLS